VAEPRWFGYISVGNVGRAQRSVTKAGGRVASAPQQMPERGEQAVFADAEGAVFGVVKSRAGDPEDFLAEAGRLDLDSTAEPRRAQGGGVFMRAVGGYNDRGECSRPTLERLCC